MNIKIIQIKETFENANFGKIVNQMLLMLENKAKNDNEPLTFYVDDLLLLELICYAS